MHIRHPGDRATGPGGVANLRKQVDMQELTEAVHLTDPMVTLEPVPLDSCTICVVLGRQRETARSLGDLSTVSDCNVEIRQHPHPRKVRRP